MTGELPEGADPAPCSGLTYPPCTCPLGQRCPVTPAERADATEHSRAADSPTLASLRERVRDEAEHRREFGQLGRLL